MDTQPVEAAAGAARAPSPAEWKHETLRLKLGRSYYRFRTLSFLEAVQIEPLVGPLMTAVKAGDQPQEYARLAMLVLRVLCPSLLQDPEDLAALGPEEVKALWAFYAAQDWGRLLQLRAMRNDGGGDDDDDADADPHLTFYKMCAAGAAMERCSGMKFMDLRFERAADCFLAMHDQWKKNEESKPKPGDLFQFFAAGGGGSSTFNPDDRPAWMTALESDAPKN